MKTKLMTLCAVVFIAASVYAQGPGPGQGPGQGQGQGTGPGMGPGRGGDPLMENFFPPELLMQHQQAIGLSDQQKSAIKAEMLKSQTKFTDLQWDMQANQEQLTQLAKQDHVDETALLAALDKLLATETRIKKEHLALLARVKNILTADQQSKLREMRPKMRMQNRNAGGQSGQRPNGPGSSGDPGGDPPDGLPQE